MVNIEAPQAHPGGPAKYDDLPPAAWKAFATYLLAIICFDLMAVLVRVLLDRYSAPELSAYRNMLGVFPSLILMIASGELRLRGANLRIDRWKLALSRGVAVAFAQLFFYTGIGALALATVSSLGQTVAFFVVLLSIFILGERVGPGRWIALAVGFVGAIWIIRPGGDAFNLFALMPIGAAACYAYAMVTVRLFDKSVSNALLYLYSSFASAIGATILALFTTSFSPITSWLDAVLILSMATFGGCGVLFLMIAFRMAAPSALAIFGYIGILTAFFWGWVFFGEAPVGDLFPGALLIVGAGVFVIWRERWRS